MDKVTPKTYPVEAAAQEEWPRRLEFEWTPDRKPCQVHVTSNLGRRHTHSPGSCGGPEAFIVLWSEAVRFGTDPSAAQAVWDAVPPATIEERGRAEE